MQIVTLDEIQRLGGFLLSDGKLSFQDQVFVKGGSFPGSSEQFISAMVEKYEVAGIKCLLVSSSGMITIWRCEKKAESPQKTISSLPLTAPSKKIVHIDDSPIECKIMATILEELKCECSHINNAMLAVSSLLKLKPDLIFLDLNMPIVNGYEICAQLRRVDMFKETPVVIVTGNDGLVDRVRAKMSGATDFISKPIDREKIANIINKYLQV